MIAQMKGSRMQNSCSSCVGENHACAWVEAKTAGKHMLCVNRNRKYNGLDATVF